MKIEEISINDRPRERALAFGLQTLSNNELLALFIRSGYKGKSAIEIANEILNKYQLAKLSEIPLSELTKIKGISKAKALEILAIFEMGKRLERERIFDKDILCEKEKLDKYLIKNIGYLAQENVLGIYLNMHNQIIDIKTLFIGTLNSANFNPREIFKAALSSNATKIILAHNHPSGSDYPSHQDIIVTRQILDIGKMMQIEVVDHLIVTSHKVTSILEKRWL